MKESPLRDALPTPAEPVQTFQRQRYPGVDLTVFGRRGFKELHLTLRPLPGEKPAALVRRLKGLLREHEAAVVRHEIFGPINAHDETMRALNEAFRALDWPVIWVEGSSCRGESLRGMHVFAVCGAKVETVSLRDQAVGRIFNDGLATHCLLGDIRPTDVRGDRFIQAKQAYANLEAALEAARMEVSDVFRTWFFLEDILAWYGPFNTARTQFYVHHSLLGIRSPASTGVGGRNPAGAALVMGAWAIRPVDGAMQVRELPSPLQCEAPSYGSYFSRAVELIAPAHRRLLVSGTASIAPDGRSVREGDVRGQIELTMDVVREILASRQMDFPGVIRATAYLKRAADVPTFTAWCAANGLAFLPLVITETDICRDELLFEIELDALVVETVTDTKG